MKKFKSSKAVTATRVGLALGIATSALVAMSLPSQATVTSVTVTKVALTTKTDTPVEGAALALTVTGASFQDTDASAAVLSVLFTDATSCPAFLPPGDVLDGGTYKNTSGSDATATDFMLYGNSLTVVSTKKITVATPATIDIPNMGSTATSGTDVKVCFYGTAETGGSATASVAATSLGSGTFTVYPAPTFTSISSATGSYKGGSSVTIIGANFTSKATAVLTDGTKDYAIKLTHSETAPTTTMTGVIPKFSGTLGTALDLEITATGGTVTSTDAFTYPYVIDAIKPYYGPISGGTTITVTGKGFTTLASSGQVVAFATGAYVPTGTSSTGIAKCGTVTVVSDTKLTCITPDMTTVVSGTVDTAISAPGKAVSVFVASDYVKNGGTAVSGAKTTTMSQGSTFTFASF